MTNREEEEINLNKAIRGYIIRSLVKGNNYHAFVRQISNAMMASNIIYNADISKYLGYLEDAGYIEFVDKKMHAFNVYEKDGIVKLTKKGIDLAEGTIDDPGVDV